MNIQSALSITERLLRHGEQNYWSEDYLKSLSYLIEFAKTVANVPTDHDAEAEMDGWDQFFEDIKKAVK